MADDDSVAEGPERAVPPDEGTTAEPTTAESAAAAPTPVLKTRWRDRAWSFRAMLAVVAASLVIGGVVGGVIGAAAGGDDDHGRYQMGPWGPGMKMPPGWRHGGPGYRGPGGPQWRWNDGQQPGQQLTPYGTPNPSAPATPSPPGSTG